MLFGKKGKKFIENNFAEMVALVGGAMKYIEFHGNLNGYDYFYLENKNKDGFHYRMQKYGDKVIRKELRIIGVHCKKSKTKRFYRYSQKGHDRIDAELYDYFKYIMDYILNEDILIKLTMCNIFQLCRCEVELEYNYCLNAILDWQYKRLVKFSTYITIFDEEKKEKAGALLKKLNSYSRFNDFKKECMMAH